MKGLVVGKLIICSGQANERLRPGHRKLLTGMG
jgi:hypothetical protein